MPNRWLKEAYCASERIQAVDADARDLWVRLVVSVDDYGLFDARPQIIASTCFPLQPDARKCEQLLDKLEKGRLLVRYTVDSKPYLILCQWYERPRGKPKFPIPPLDVLASANACEQLRALARPHDHDHDHVHDHVTTAPSAPARKESYPQGFEKAWEAYPRRQGDNPKPKALKAYRARLKQGHTPEEILAGIERYKRWLVAMGKDQTEFVKQAATFFGPDKPFLAEWAVGNGKQPHAPAPEEWWALSNGIWDKAELEKVALTAGESKLSMPEQTMVLWAKLCVKLGDGPWDDKRNTTLQRFIGALRSRGAGNVPVEQPGLAS